jgi:hypothetical protein
MCGWASARGLDVATTHSQRQVRESTRKAVEVEQRRVVFGGHIRRACLLCIWFDCLIVGDGPVLDWCGG